MGKSEIVNERIAVLRGIRIPQRRPYWVVTLRFRPTLEDRIEMDKLVTEIDRRSGDKCPGVRWHTVLARLDQRVRKEFGSTKAERRRWKGRVRRVRLGQNVHRTLIRGTFDEPCIEVWNGSELRVISPPWHRRAGIEVKSGDDDPLIAVEFDENAPEIADREALEEEIRAHLEAAWKESEPWDDVKARLSEKYAGFWVDGSEVQRKADYDSR